MELNRLRPKQAAVVLVALISLVVCQRVQHAAASTEQPSHTSGQVTISVNDPRPLAAAIATLEQRYGWVITYEDPPYLHPSQISDVTRAVRKVYRPTKPPVLIPAGGTFEFAHTIQEGLTAPEPLTVLPALLESYSRSGNPGVFRLLRTGSIFHVVPAMVKNVHGVLEPHASILDAPILLDDTPRTAFEAVQLILENVGRSRGVKVSIGTVPLNALTRMRVRGSATSESARAALMRALEGSALRFSWRLLRGPGEQGGYALNVHAVKDRPE